MSDARKLAAVRLVHTVIYLVMAASCFVVLGAGLGGWTGPLLWGALVLVAIETAIVVGNGFRCPLTKLAVRYGAEKGYAFDTFLPETITRHTFRFFSLILLVGCSLLAARWLGVLA